MNNVLNILILRNLNMKEVISINICFIMGKIITELEFSFIMSNNLNFKKSIHTSILQFEIELKNKSHILVKGYDEIADKCYQELKKGNVIVIIGELNANMEIILQEYELI